ncbi:unnamed protein product [Calicophoron daubneyi]|uniref:Uncharacterized protein n=1 Tax=Calicophoron daubneyi TaxID=300641 RepID=A0AAV2T6U1_CALDB
MGDMKDIEPNHWRTEREITSEDTVRTIISSLLHLQSRLSIYVSNEEMEKLITAKQAFDSRQMDIDELLVVTQEARRKAEERQAIKNRSLEELQQALSRILAKTESWPLPLKSGIRKRCDSEQSWLDGICDRAANNQTAEEITTRIKKEVGDIEDHKKKLNEYFGFAEESAKLPDELLSRSRITCSSVHCSALFPTVVLRGLCGFEFLRDAGRSNVIFA